MGRLVFSKLASERIKEQRNIVISVATDESGNEIGYSVAQQFVGDENGKPVELFLNNGGLGILTAKGLYGLQKAVNDAVEKINRKNP